MFAPTVLFLLFGKALRFLPGPDLIDRLLQGETGQVGVAKVNP